MSLPQEPMNQQSTKAEVQCLPSLCRGLYHRVAQKLGCDPSYVSRVARGERTSQAVSDALRAEIQLAWERASEFANAAKTELSLKPEIGSASKKANGKAKSAST